MYGRGYRIFYFIERHVVANTLNQFISRPVRKSALTQPIELLFFAPRVSCLENFSDSFSLFLNTMHGQCDSGSPSGAFG